MRLSLSHNAALRLLVLLLAATAWLASPAAKPRTAKQVRNEKQKNEQQIKIARQKLNLNAEETKRRVNELSLIEAKVAVQTRSIDSLQSQLDSIASRISLMTDTIALLDKKASILRDSYGRTLRAIRARRQGMSDLSFIFSASSFMEAWKRARYLHEVGRYTEAKARDVTRARQKADTARANLEKMQNSRLASLSDMETRQKALQSSRSEAAALITTLKNNRNEITRELQRREEQNRALDRELDRIIAEEIRRREEEARRKKEAEEKKAREAAAKAKGEASANKGSSTAAKPEAKPTAKPQTKPTTKSTFEAVAEADRRLTGSFRDNRGRLLFPVAGSYTVTGRFGTNTHPELSKVKVNNSGIDIDVPKGTAARAVFQGTVSSIFRMEGYHNIVILRHGEYLTVYAGIDNLSVEKGDHVERGQSLGTIYSDPAEGGRTVLHFEIRLEKQKLDPLEWVR